MTLAQVHGGALSLAQAIGAADRSVRRLCWAPTRAGWRRARRRISACSIPERVWRVEAGQLPGKAQNTPFDGRALEGGVLGTWKAGRRVFG